MSHDTIDILEQLLDRARRGDIVGMAVVAMLPGGKFMTATTGECYASPITARGILGVLDDELAQAARRRREEATEWGDL